MSDDFIRRFADPRVLGYSEPALTRRGARRRARHDLRELLKALDPPTDEVQATLDVLYNAIGEASGDARVHGFWRMNAAWKQKIIDTAKWDKPQLTLYGLPIMIDESTIVPVLCSPEENRSAR